MNTDDAARETQAAARFGALSVAAQMSLAREIVEARGAALKQDYVDLSLVTAGYRAQRDSQGQAMFHPEPCVILGVARKWRTADGTDDPADQRLPRVLITPGKNGQLYAVPTDVQPADWFSGGVARASSAVWADAPENYGTLACAVRVQTPAGVSSFALSAMHVLSPWAQMDLPQPDAGEEVHNTDTAAIVGTSSAWGGALREVALSFDAQLGGISDPAWFNAAFAGWALPSQRPYIRRREELDALAATQNFIILAPGNHPTYPGRGPMMAQFRSYAGSDVPIIYKVRVGGMRARMYVRHRELVQLEVNALSSAPAEGDSGSAVLTWRLDGTLALAGMFIASLDQPADRVAYMLPAWQLFDLANWASLPAGTTRMTPRFSIP